MNCPLTETEDDQPILCKEAEAAVQSLQGSRLELTTSKHNWSKQVSLSRQSATRSGRQKNGQPCGPSPRPSHFPKKGNLQQCQNYRTISLISHVSKVMLKTILNRLKPQAEKIIAEEQTGFRAGKSTTDQIFNLQILCEKYLEHQQDLYNVFIDFKKSFHKVWHAAL